MGGSTYFFIVLALGVVVLLVVFIAKQRGTSTAGGHAGPRHAAAPLTASSQLPINITLVMEQYGRYIIDPLRSNLDGGEIWKVIIPLYPLAQADPDAFVIALKDKALPVGGWSVYGAARTVTELLGVHFEHPAHDALRIASLQFLRERGVPNSMLTGNEWSYWLDGQGKTEPWLICRSKPATEKAPITDLTSGEVRRIAQVFPEVDSNIILVRRHNEGGYVSVIDKKWSDENSTRSQGDWERADTLNDLYWKVGRSFQVPTYWYHDELEPYFPLPKPRLE